MVWDNGLNFYIIYLVKDCKYVVKFVYINLCLM